MHGMMDIINKENEDEEMEDQDTITSSTTPMHSLAQLAAKLKKLMEMESTQVLMLIETEFDGMDTKDPKKRAQAPTPLAGIQAATSKHTQI